MIEVQRTDVFDVWLAGLTDSRARTKILVRAQRLASGNPGDVQPVGDGVSEMRIHWGPGYRVYYTQIGQRIVMLLYGGDKAIQAKDIARAKAMAAELRRDDKQ